MHGQRADYIVRGMGALAVAAFGALIARNGVNQLWLIPPAIVAVLAGLYEYRNAQRREHIRIEAYLKLLFAQLDLPHSAYARATYHEIRRDWRSLWRRTYFYQVINYVPDGSRGRGRTFSTTKGVASRAVTNKETFVANFETAAKWRAAMLTTYGYSKEELKRRTPDRRSYMCFPVLESKNQRMIGLVFFDARIAGTFPVVGKEDLIEQAIEQINDMLVQ
jgi:hypothetical protein